MLVLAATLTVLATGLGVIPVAVLGGRRVAQFRAALAGVAGGAMLVAAVSGLAEPGFRDGRAGVVVLGAAAGVALIAGVHRRLTATGLEGRWEAVAVGLFVHSLPEGMAVGAAFASGEAGLDVLVVLAIAAQNVPEGTATALPMQEAGHGTVAQTLAAIATSVPQLVGAIGANWLVERVDGLLPASLGFAAGAMFALVALDVAPTALAADHRRQGAAGLAVGGGLMLLLARAVGA